jgi:ubiquinone/menaquinone biosynthesis C-methylase UbiE
MKSSGNYQGIVAESYDLWFPGETFEDTEFYKEMMAKTPGPALEVGCGTGRLLIPYLQNGLDVDGVDCSKEMLAICRQKAEQKGLAPTLYEQYMQELDLPRKYKTIYIPFCSFMILAEREEAMQALLCFYKSLESEGQVLISLFIPKEDTANKQKQEWVVRRVGTRQHDGATIVVNEASSYNMIEQVKTGWYRYETYKDGSLIEAKFHTMKLRWYYKYEFMMMLEKIGFREVFVHGDLLDEEVTDRHGTMVFRAKK